MLSIWTGLEFVRLVKSKRVCAFPKRQTVTSSELKKFADDNIKFDENGRKLFNRVENTVVKEEIARYKQFLLFPQRFERLVLQTRKNQILFLKGLN